MQQMKSYKSSDDRHTTVSVGMYMNFNTVFIAIRFKY